MRSLLKAILLCSLIAVLSAAAQTLPSRSDIEQRVGAAPEERRTYERFWNWTAALPAGERGTSENEQYRQDTLLAKYRSWLVQTGTLPEDAEKEIATLRKRGSAEVAEFWNRYLVQNRADWLNSGPNAFLVEMVKGRRVGKALDVAMGQGRNALWLAAQGWDVTGFDPADQAIAFAQGGAKRQGLTIHTEVTTMEQFQFGNEQWDLIVLSYAGCSEVADKVQRALKPGGVVVEEAFHTDALKTMKVGGSLCRPAELVSAFKGLRVIRYEEPIGKPDFAPRSTRLVRFAAEKPVE